MVKGHTAHVTQLCCDKTLSAGTNLPSHSHSTAQGLAKHRDTKNAVQCNSYVRSYATGTIVHVSNQRHIQEFIDTIKILKVHILYFPYENCASSFSLLFFFFFGKWQSVLVDCPQNLGMGLSVSSLLHKVCKRAGGSEGVRQWHREEPELGTAPAQENTGNLQKGVTGQGFPSEREQTHH